MKALPLVVVALLAPADSVGAGELSVSHAALERFLVSSLLTQSGRLYLEGGPEDTCRYAFVQEPKVSGGAGRLSIRFVFSGRAGASVAGRCVGPGDTLDLTASGVPAYAGGELWLSGLRLEARDSSYFRAIAGLLQSQLERRLRVPVRARLEEALTAVSAATAVRLSIGALEIPEIAVDERGLRLTFEERLLAQ
jgi:hypothetical protein